MIVLVIGLLLCFLSLGLFLQLRLTDKGVYALIAKAVASLCFVLLAVFLLATKTGLNVLYSYAASALIVGLVCGLIGDILLELKVIYPFHEDKYLKSGMLAFSLAHLFNITALILLAQNSVNMFVDNWLYIAIVFVVAAILTVLIYFTSTKMLKFNYGNAKNITNIYSFILMFTTLLSIYVAMIISTIPVYILAIGLVLFLISDLILSVQYFGGKQTDKSMAFFNHLFYYMAQILIASFIFFL